MIVLTILLLIEITVNQLFSSIEELAYCIENSEFTVEIKHKSQIGDKMLSASKKYSIKNKERILKRLEKILLVT